MPVPLIDLTRDKKRLAAVEAAVVDVVRSGHYVLGAEVENFERELAGYLGCKHVLALSSGTDALLVPLMALGIGPGDEVVLPTYSFFSTAGGVARTGATPVFVDIEPVHCNIDPQRLEEALQRCKNPKAVIGVHLFGTAFDVDAVRSICRRFSVPFIEDAAQGIGCIHDGRKLGAHGIAGAWSTSPTRNLGGIGDGGFLTSNDDEFAARCRLLRNHGQAQQYEHHMIGGNFRMDAIQATALRVKMHDIESITAIRRSNAERYRELFADAELGDWAELPTDTDRHAYHQFVVRLPEDQRDTVITYLRQQGIGCAIYYPIPFHRQPCFAYLGNDAADFPVAEQASRTTLALPIFQGLTEAEQVDVVGALKRFPRPVPAS